jgi:EmrB/QacA subfamily drug resistance transporter
MLSKRWTLTVVCAATAMLMLDIAVVNTALNPIARDLHTSLGALRWIIDAYTLTLAAAVLSAGSLADRFGRRRLFIGGLALFTLASGGCAAAGSIGVLDAARAVQGLGAAVMFAVSLAILADAFPGVTERRQALAAYGATIGGAFAVGPLVGGALASGLGWRWIFLVNLPLGVACLVATRRSVRESRDPATPPVDVAGQAALAVSLFALVFGMLQANDRGWGDPLIIASLGVAAAGLIVFIAVERAVAHPMLPLGLFRRGGFTAAQTTAFGISASVFAGYLYLTIYLQAILGLSPIETGLVYLPGTLASFFVAGATASIGARYPARSLLVLGLMLSAAGVVLMAVMLQTSSSWVAFEPGAIVAMVGVGLINPTLSGVALGSVEATKSGLAAGANDTFRQAGIAIGVALLGALIPGHVSSPGSFVSGLHEALIVAAVLLVVSAAVVWRLLASRQTDPATEAPTEVEMVAPEAELAASAV